MLVGPCPNPTQGLLAYHTACNMHTHSLLISLDKVLVLVVIGRLRTTGGKASLYIKLSYSAPQPYWSISSVSKSTGLEYRRPWFKSQLEPGIFSRYCQYIFQSQPVYYASLEMNEVHYATYKTLALVLIPVQKDTLSEISYEFPEN